MNTSARDTSGGDTAFTMALREASRGREINLGEGIIPQSTPINETEEYKDILALHDTLFKRIRLEIYKTPYSLEVEWRIKKEEK